ncbi:sugar-binding transcriptional regulator [Frigoribacterium sp. Leaf172]|uniref:sugar-binding transcriptional regulator n=1 Tax=Frigoribacterium sp. Leaf172 TaxID=1736285 RepID=UPI0009EA7D35|nr:sugar-binding domain-containing protein [Frigoribacterium sp. Leaf172]
MTDTTDRVGAPAPRAGATRFPLALVYQAARLYYLDDVRQSEIAVRLAISRPTVSRLIAEARRSGMVRIDVMDPSVDETAVLAARLSAALDLRCVHVAPRTHASTLGTDLAASVTAAISDMGLAAGDALLVSLGRTIYDVARSGLLPPLPGVELVPTAGGQTEALPWFQTNEITRLAAESSGARPTFLFAPALPSPAMRATLDDDSTFRHVLGLWAGARGALLGIGAPTSSRPVLPQAVPADPALFADAAGDVCLNFFRADGSAIEFPGSGRMVRTSRETLAAIPFAVGVAVGRDKVTSIVGAARGRLITGLVTDAATARAVLESL